MRMQPQRALSPRAAMLEAKMHEHEQRDPHGGQRNDQFQPDEQSPDPTMGGHGMLVFGEDVLYMSHLPMFMRPHNFQVLLEVDFEEDVRRLLVDDREATGDGMYTWDPREFPIAELDPASGGPARDSMVGNLVRGHFERGGTPIAMDVVARILDVVHFRELDIDARPDEGRELTYLCFGRGEQLHLAHEITAGPDFDQILTARLVPGTITDQAGRPAGADAGDRIELRHAQPVSFPDRRNTPDGRMTPDKPAQGFFFQSIGPGGSHGFRAQVEAVKELYLEIDELAGKHHHH
jgi:hypothetical protein